VFASSPAVAPRHRDVLAAVIALLLLGGVFGVVMHGMPSGHAVALKPTRDVGGVATTQPEVKGGGVVTAAPTTAVPRTTAPPPPAPPKYATSVFRAAFPVTPVRQSHDFSVDNYKFQIVMYLTDQPDRVYGVSYFDVPADASVDLTQAAKGSAAGTGGTLRSTIPTTFHGFRAVEATIDVDGGILREVIVRTPSRVFMVLVGGDGDLVKEFYDFRDSVEIL
jgi:hypothetical protein